jgi:hypothetical protein
MNLNTVVDVKRPASADDTTQWRDGYQEVKSPRGRDQR